MSEKLTHWKELTDREYLGGWEFEEGEVKEFEIVSVTKKEVVGANGKKTMEPVATLKDAKPFVLNSVNMDMIELISGTPYIEKWKGLKIQIFFDPKVKFAGKFVGGLRVKYQDAKSQPKPKEKVVLESGSEDFTKAVNFITDADNKADGFDKLYERLSARYKISPNVKKELESKFNEN